MGEHPTIVLKWINRKSSKRNKTALARFSDNQIELSMEILMSISRRPRALYLVDLVRLLTKGGFCSRGAPGPELRLNWAEIYDGLCSESGACTCDNIHMAQKWIVTV